MGRKLRVLYCLAYASQANGVVTFVKNYLSEIYEDIEASVVCGDNDLSDSFKMFCEDRNIPLYLLPNPYDNGPFKYIKAIKRFFEEHHDFDVVHCNIPNYGMFYLKQAKKYGIQARIMHSHSPNVPHQFPLSILEKAMECEGVKNANAFLACSNAAGKYLFGKRKYAVIPNSINYAEYQYSLRDRELLRKKYSISPDALAILFVGRIDKEKNPIFAAKVFEEVYKASPDSVLIYLGNGKLADELKRYADNSFAKNKIFLLGNVDDTRPFYSMADCLLMPSIFEGLPLVAIEAQASGLPCLLSDAINDETIISKNCIKLDINSHPSLWATAILNLPKRNTNGDSFLDQRFDLINNRKILLDFYASICNGEKDEQSSSSK